MDRGPRSLARARRRRPGTRRTTHRARPRGRTAAHCRLPSERGSRPMTATAVQSAIRVRDARTGDNASLRALAMSCPMEGDISFAVAREPDFFALNRLEGTRWRLGVAESQPLPDRDIAGCVMAAARTTYLRGQPRETLYAGDLKVHPSARRIGVADALTQWAVDVLADLGDSDTPILVTVLAGNRAMERRVHGRGGAAAFTRVSTIRAFSIPLLWPRSRRAL